MDAEAQEALGLAADADPAEAAERFAPVFADAGWSGADGQIATSSPAAGWGRSAPRRAPPTRSSGSPAPSAKPSRSARRCSCPAAREHHADETPGGANVWLARDGDCPPLQASSGGGSSSTLENGLILAGLAALLLLIFGLRPVRRRRTAPSD